MEMQANYYSYHVTKDGRVFNKWGAELKANSNGRGYSVVNITTAPYTSRTKAVHRLVAEVYLPNPYKLSDVDHVDSNRSNNHIDNLRWLSHGDNIKHSYDSGNRSAVGSNNARAILDEDAVHNICCLIERGWKLTEISRQYCYKYALLTPIKIGVNWKHISKDYSF